MSILEDYYRILGVDSEASAEAIRAARNRKAIELHPDRLSHVPEEERLEAQEELKRVNRAYEVLGDEAKRRRYHTRWLRDGSPPKPVVAPDLISFGRSAPGQLRAASFVIRNDAGAYDSIWISDPDSWVKITGYASLEADDELPLRVDIGARGVEPGKRYSESIAVRLDDAEVEVKISLRTAAARKPTPAATPTPAPVPSQGISGAGLLLLWTFHAVIIALAIILSDGWGGDDRRASPVYRSQNSVVTAPYRSPPTPNPWPPGLQPPSFDQIGAPGSPTNMVGNQRWRPGVQWVSPVTRPGPSWTRPGLDGRSSNSSGGRWGSGVTRPSSSGFGGTSEGFKFPGR